MKFQELENLNLNGFVCYMRQHNKKGKFVYSLQKELINEKRKFIVIKSLFENIEFQTLHELTDLKLK